MFHLGKNIQPCCVLAHRVLTVCLLLTACQHIFGQKAEKVFEGSLVQPVLFSSDGFPNQKPEIGAHNKEYTYTYRIKSLQDGLLIKGTFVDFDLAYGQKIEIFYEDWSSSSSQPDVEFTQMGDHSPMQSRPDFLTNSSVVVVNFTNPHVYEERYIGWTLNCTFHPESSGEVLQLPFTRCGSLDPYGGFYHNSLDGLDDSSSVDCIFHVKPGVSGTDVYVNFTCLDSSTQISTLKFVQATTHNKARSMKSEEGMHSNYCPSFYQAACISV